MPLQIQVGNNFHDPELEKWTAVSKWTKVVCYLKKKGGRNKVPSAGEPKDLQGTDRNIDTEDYEKTEEKNFLKSTGYLASVPPSAGGETVKGKTRHTNLRLLRAPRRKGRNALIGEKKTPPRENYTQRKEGEEEERKGTRKGEISKLVME